MAFSTSAFKPFKLEMIQRINHNTNLFRFALPSRTEVAGLPIMSCVMFRANIVKDGQTEEVIRPYTPTSRDQDKGFVDFVIKDYPRGKMSRHVHSLKVGESIDIKGPFEKYSWKKNPVKHVGMIAGGTGITPMLQLLRNIFESQDRPKISLIFANQTQEDILFKEELDRYAKEGNLSVTYVLERPPVDWSGRTGYVTSDLLKTELPSPSEPSSVIFVCGPPPFMESISGDKNPDKSQGTLRGYLNSLGYDQEHVYKL
ncbi:hypothetical protein BDB01DRAFT_772613 [Pilobolus umbonatus]|nr:hypothetical protein BDB01DRAFT_772613 [Pilobolus umbonatus]